MATSQASHDDLDAAAAPTITDRSSSLQYPRTSADYPPCTDLPDVPTRARQSSRFSGRTLFVEYETPGKGKQQDGDTTSWAPEVEDLPEYPGSGTEEDPFVVSFARDGTYWSGALSVNTRPDSHSSQTLRTRRTSLFYGSGSFYAAWDRRLSVSRSRRRFTSAESRASR